MVLTTQQLLTEIKFEVAYSSGSMCVSMHPHMCTKFMGSFPSTTKWVKIIEVKCLIKNVWHPSLPAGENLVKPDNTILHKKELPAEVCRIQKRKERSVNSSFKYAQIFN